MNDLKVYIDRKEVAQMNYGPVPVIVKLVEGGDVKPPMHVSVIFPNRALQVIKVFGDPKKALEIVKSCEAEDYVDFIDKPTNRKRLISSKENGTLTMVLDLN